MIPSGRYGDRPWEPYTGCTSTHCVLPAWFPPLLSVMNRALQAIDPLAFLSLSMFLQLLFPLVYKAVVVDRASDYKDTEIKREE